MNIYKYIYMVGMRNSNVSEKIDKYFYRDPNGNIVNIRIIALKKYQNRIFL